VRILAVCRASVMVMSSTLRIFLAQQSNMETQAKLIESVDLVTVAPKMRRLPLFAKRDGADRPSPLDLPYQRHVVRRGRAIRRLLWVALITPVCCAIQAVLLLLPGQSDRSFAKFYWASIATAVGLSVRVIGAPAGSPEGRRVIYACNHSSWLDIAALGGQIKACFVAK